MPKHYLLVHLFIDGIDIALIGTQTKVYAKVDFSTFRINGNGILCCLNNKGLLERVKCCNCCMLSSLIRYTPLPLVRNDFLLALSIAIHVMLTRLNK